MRLNRPDTGIYRHKFLTHEQGLNPLACMRTLRVVGAPGIALSP